MFVFADSRVNHNSMMAMVWCMSVARVNFWFAIVCFLIELLLRFIDVGYVV
jgi:hypothetical protein